MLNGLEILVLAIFIIGGCVIAYCMGVRDGRAQTLEERLEDLLAPLIAASLLEAEDELAQGRSPAGERDRAAYRPTPRYPSVN